MYWSYDCRRVAFYSDSIIMGQSHYGHFCCLGSCYRTTHRSSSQPKGISDLFEFCNIYIFIEKYPNMSATFINISVCTGYIPVTYLENQQNIIFYRQIAFYLPKKIESQIVISNKNAHGIKRLVYLFSKILVNYLAMRQLRIICIMYTISIISKFILTCTVELCCQRPIESRDLIGQYTRVNAY
jgi:hypothetical protein